MILLGTELPSLVWEPSSRINVDSKPKIQLIICFQSPAGFVHITSLLKQKSSMCLCVCILFPFIPCDGGLRNAWNGYLAGNICVDGPRKGELLFKTPWQQCDELFFCVFQLKSNRHFQKFLVKSGMLEKCMVSLMKIILFRTLSRGGKGISDRKTI